MSERVSARYLSAPTFTQWLVATPDGPFAALAAFAVADRCWPARARTLLAFVRHVRVHANDTGAPTERQVRATYVAFESDVRRGRRILSRVSARSLPADQRRPTKSYSLAPRTDGRIRAIQAQTGAPSRGAVIDALVDRWYAERGKAR